MVDLILMLVKMKCIEVRVRDALESSPAAAAGSHFQSPRKILRIIWELTFRRRRKRLLKVTQVQPDFVSSHCLKQEENSFWHTRPVACFPRARRRAGEQNACAAAAGRAAVGPLVQKPSAGDPGGSSDGSPGLCPWSHRRAAAAEVAQWPPVVAGGPGRAAQLLLLGKFKVQRLV